jgi:hypothetical protein
VEDNAVVEAVPGELREILDGLGRVGGKELDLDRAVVGVKRGVRHAASLRGNVRGGGDP